MKIDKWIERGLNSLSSDEIFDGMQLIEGAIRRVIRKNDPEIALKIIKDTNEILVQRGYEDVYCKFILNIIPLFKKKSGELEWFELFPEILLLLRKSNTPKCISRCKNKLILETKMIEVDFIQSLMAITVKKHYPKEILADMYYYHAGHLVLKQDYVKTFDVLRTWNDQEPSSQYVLVYLTLAELNAYEIDGCGKYLEEAKSISNSSQYVDLASHVFKSVEAGSYDLYSSIIEEFTDIVNIENDVLLKGLCDGISGFLKPKGNKGLFSLFGG